MNVIHDVMNTVLPYIITLLEIMGIFIVTWSVIKEFWEYIQNAFMQKELDIQFNLAVGLATGLEFKMAAEILKTVIVRTLDELYVLGAVILIRALLSVLIRFEINEPYVKRCDNGNLDAPKKSKAKKSLFKATAVKEEPESEQEQEKSDSE